MSMVRPVRYQLYGAWRDLMAAFGVVDCVASRSVYRELIRRYGERHRYYHTVAHLADVVGRLGPVDPRRPVAYAAAFFHDAVYNPRRTDNEALSARLMIRRLSTLGVSRAKARVTAEHDIELPKQIVGQLNDPLIRRKRHA